MIYTLVEGHGEVEAMGNLLNRLWTDLGLPYKVFAKPRRWPKIHIDDGLIAGCELLRGKSDCEGLFIIKDEDDLCPVEIIPAKVALLKSLNMPFPVAYVLLYREYETLLLASLESIRGRAIKDMSGFERAGIAADAILDLNPEEIRNAKGMLSSFYPKNRIYKPTLDQLPLTRMIDFNLLREKELPCFETLERAMKAVSDNCGKSIVYPVIK